MAFVLRSDNTVADPDGLIPVLTSAGVVYQGLWEYILTLSSLGFDLHASEVSALQTFERNLKTAGVWDDILEIYPLIGNNVETAAVKLKYLTAQSMTPANSLDNSHFEFDGEGRLLGKDVRPTESFAYQPRFLTGLTVGDLNDSWMATALIGDMRSDPGTSVAGHLWGASQSAGATFRTEFALNANVIALTIENSSRRGAYVVQGMQEYPNGIYQARASGSNISLHINDSQIISDTLTSRNTGGEDRELALFAMNPFPTESRTGYFQGKMRFFVVSKGLGGEAERKVLNDEVERVAQALGRSFS